MLTTVVVHATFEELENRTEMYKELEDDGWIKIDAPGRGISTTWLHCYNVEKDFKTQEDYRENFTKVAMYASEHFKNCVTKYTTDMSIIVVPTLQVEVESDPDNKDIIFQYIKDVKDENLYIFR